RGDIARGRARSHAGAISGRERGRARRPRVGCSIEEAVLFAGSLRLPLATGASTVRSLSIPVGIFQLFAFGPLFIPFPDWIVIPLGFLWAGWFFTVVWAVIVGMRRRASDIELSSSGVAIQGGSCGGLRISWDRIDPDRCAVNTEILEDG